MNGIERIAAERQRQIEAEGWSIERDVNLYRTNELPRAAICYLLGDTIGWPWDDQWWKPTPDNRIRELEKAGALIAAEIDRLMAAGKECGCNCHRTKLMSETPSSSCYCCENGRDMTPDKWAASKGDNNE